MDDLGITLTDAMRYAYITKDAVGRTIVYLKGEDHDDATVNLEWIDEDKTRFEIIEDALIIYNIH